MKQGRISILGRKKKKLKEERKKEEIRRKIEEERKKEEAEKRLEERRIAKMEELGRIINEARARGTLTGREERMFEIALGYFKNKQWRRFEDMVVKIETQMKMEIPAKKEAIEKKEITTREKIDRLMAEKLDKIIEELGVPNTKEWRVKIAKMGVIKLPKKEAVRRVREELEREKPLVEKIKKPEDLPSILEREWDILERMKRLDEEKIELFRKAVELKKKIMTEDLSAEEHGSALKKYRSLLGEILSLKK